MKPVKKFALIVDGRSHQEEDYWDMQFYNNGLRPDANVCVSSAQDAITLLAKAKQGPPKPCMIIIWDELPSVDCMETLKMISSSKSRKDLLIAVFSPSTYNDDRVETFYSIGATVVFFGFDPNNPYAVLPQSFFDEIG